MAGFTQQSFTSLKALVTQAYQAAANQAVTIATGGFLPALINAIALLMFNQQRNIVQVQNIARLLTSTGADVDSFVNPFGVTRGGATPSSGRLSYVLPSPVSTLTVIPVGAMLAPGNGLVFTVVADTTNGAYSAADGGYVIASGASMVSLTVQCTTAGSVSNVLAGTSWIVTGGGTFVGAQSITNPAAFTNGTDQESDVALKTRFTLKLSAPGGGSVNALAAATLAVVPGLTYSVADLTKSTDTTVGTSDGYVTVVLNELGQAAGPSTTLVAAVQTALIATKAAGITAVAIPPTLVVANVTATIVLPATIFIDVAQPAAVTAIETYLNNIGLDPEGGTTTASIGEIYAAALMVAGVSNVQNVMINGAAVDVTAAFAHQIVAGTVTLTVTGGQ